MAEALLVQPDERFIRNVVNSGGGDLKKCFQCATCSVVCSLSPEDSPFPRKQMIEAQWGMKEQLVADPAIWLCHNCGDCTTQCPRGARPGEVFGALRQQAIEHFAFPNFLGRWASNPKALLALLLLPILIFGYVALTAPPFDSARSREFADMFPLGFLEPLFFIVSGLAVLAFAIGIARFVKALRASGADGPILSGLVPALGEIATHKRFTNCTEQKNRYWGHLLTLWGFVGLAVMGTAVGIGTMVGVMHTPLALNDPWKIFANICAVIILIGSVILLVERVRDPVKRAASTYFDWLFLLTLVAVVLTGILSQLLRLAQAVTIMYPVYFVHLVLIFALFLYAPYTKFAHLTYRTVAMAAARKRQT
jgi:quinone-modifying oxidoreductase subunit QmoC